jgi:transcriptional regulator with XRE-family HTH domain
MPISGHFLPSVLSADKRNDARRKLSLLARGSQHDGTGIEVQIHNISGTGLLFESDIKLAAGDRIEIELPHAGDITAVVIWASGRLFGCQFEGPVSPATLSAVELKSAVDSAPVLDDDQSEPVGDDAFGARLLRLRTSAGLSQVEVADLMGVSAPSISSWEHGRAHPKPGRMAKLATILGVETADLLEDPAPLPAPVAMQEAIDRGREQIARAIGISPDKVRITIEF